VERTDLIIIDAESVDPDLIAMARRACPDAQVIALAREFREADCIAILDADADYLARPFRAHDLAARVRVAELKRFNATGRPRTYRKGQLAFDLFNCRLMIDNRPVALSPSELAILSLLASQQGVVAEHKRLVAELGLDGSERSRGTLRSHVLRLRRKIERDPLHPEILLAESGVGYRLAMPSEEPLHRARDSLPPDEGRSELL
jgi:two-component system KDP operon response regulator KdpE